MVKELVRTAARVPDRHRVVAHEVQDLGVRRNVGAGEDFLAFEDLSHEARREELAKAAEACDCDGLVDRRREPSGVCIGV